MKIIPLNSPCFNVFLQSPLTTFSHIIMKTILEDFYEKAQIALNTFDNRFDYLHTG